MSMSAACSTLVVIRWVGHGPGAVGRSRGAGASLRGVAASVSFLASMRHNRLIAGFRGRSRATLLSTRGAREPATIGGGASFRASLPARRTAGAVVVAVVLAGSTVKHLDGRRIGAASSTVRRGTEISRTSSSTRCGARASASGACTRSTVGVCSCPNPALDIGTETSSGARWAIMCSQCAGASGKRARSKRIRLRESRADERRCSNAANARATRRIERRHVARAASSTTATRAPGCRRSAAFPRSPPRAPVHRGPWRSTHTARH